MNDKITEYINRFDTWRAIMSDKIDKKFESMEFDFSPWTWIYLAIPILSMIAAQIIWNRTGFSLLAWLIEHIKAIV